VKTKDSDLEIGSSLDSEVSFIVPISCDFLNPGCWRYWILWGWEGTRVDSFEVCRALEWLHRSRGDSTSISKEPLCEASPLQNNNRTH